MVYTVLRRCKWLVLLVYSAADLPSPVEDEQNDDKVWEKKKKVTSYMPASGWSTQSAGISLVKNVDAPANQKIQHGLC